ncbi:hypothetical protein M2272_002187 [Mycobacterium frederiksbergense]|uniref:Uncharacterized protein n=1 Tax=Mycolicibacterium frederiksbergense TaxID=117567 RepID=A0ABT6KXV5_9MYCO|nr:hypothetical protein [Mycolicibacterium frederiksbergense]
MTLTWPPTAGDADELGTRTGEVIAIDRSDYTTDGEGTR